VSKDGKQFENALNEAIKHVFGKGLVSVEVVNVPEGKTIEEVMTERGYKQKPEEVPRDDNADLCPICGKVHASGSQTEHHRQGALRTIEKRIEATKEMVDLWQKMHDSISTPLGERQPLHTLNEIMLAKRIHDLQRI
jgi:hypothetical protein